jgi:hypothetical protein
MPVLQPHISGRGAFLTGPSARSYAESVISLVQNYHLGEMLAPRPPVRMEITADLGADWVHDQALLHSVAMATTISTQPPAPRSDRHAAVLPLTMKLDNDQDVPATRPAATSPNESTARVLRFDRRPRGFRDRQTPVLNGAERCMCRLHQDYSTS